MKSFRVMMSNIFFAINSGRKYAKKILISYFLNFTIHLGLWVFFSSIFMKKIVSYMGNGSSFESILKYILICCAVVSVLAIVDAYVLEVTLPIEKARYYGKIYKRIYKKAKNVELRCYEDDKFYNQYTMAIDGADEKMIKVLECVCGIIIGALSTIAIFILMCSIDKYAILFMLFPLVGNFVFGHLKNKCEIARYEENIPNEKVFNYVKRVMYLKDYAKEIKLYNIFNLIKKQYTDATKSKVHIAKKYARKNTNYNFVRLTLLFSIVFEGMLLYAIYRYAVTKTMSLGELTVITSMMVSMTWIIIRLFENIMAIMKAGVYVGNIRKFLEYEEKIPEDMDGIIPSEFDELEFDNVSFSYKDETTIERLSFKIKKGDSIALVGHNGAGKSTIVKLLLRLYDPTQGEIRLNGINIKEYNLKAYRKVFATTFQDFAIFGMTIKENVLMGKKGDDSHVIDALKKAGVYEKVMSLTNGINSVMTKEFAEDGIVLSGGESQKIAIARTFVDDCEVKIFDEPSSALDPIAEYELFQNIMKEGKEHTLIFISHRLSSVKQCDKVFMLEKGKVIESGTHKELIKQDKKYAKMYIKQAMNYLAVEEGEVAL